MTIITSFVRDIAGADAATVFTFEVPQARGVGSGAGVVTVRSQSYTAEHGLLTTDDLSPGPATLRLSGQPGEYRITIPDSTEPVPLWPLMDAATPPGPGAYTTGFIRNGGGLARGEAVSLADYPGLLKDPETVYFIFDQGAL